MAVKRGKGQRLIPLEDIREGERINVERSDRLTADQIYERRWAFTVLEQVMARLRDEYRAASNLRFFDQIKKCSWTSRTGLRKPRSPANSA